MPDTRIPASPVTSANGTPVPSDGRPHFEGQLAETMDEVYWFYERVNEDTFDRYAGEYIAIYRREVVDHDSNALTLADRVAEALGIPPSRPFITFVYGSVVRPEELRWPESA